MSERSGAGEAGEVRGGGRAKYLAAPGSPGDDGEPMVTLTRGQMRELIREAVGAESRRPLLVDKQGLAMRLNCSATTIDALRKEGLPTVKLLGAVRFEPEAVLAWLGQRSADND